MPECTEKPLPQTEPPGDTVMKEAQCDCVDCRGPRLSTLSQRRAGAPWSRASAWHPSGHHGSPRPSPRGGRSCPQPVSSLLLTVAARRTIFKCGSNCIVAPFKTTRLSLSLSTTAAAVLATAPASLRTLSHCSSRRLLPLLPFVSCTPAAPVSSPPHPCPPLRQTTSVLSASTFQSLKWAQ